MTNVNFKVMLHTMSALDEPIRRKKPHAKPRQAKKWQRDRKAQRDYVARLNTHWKGENDA